MALYGQDLLGDALALAEDARRRLNAIPGVHVFGKERCVSGGLFDLDETKLTINVAGLGMTGFEARQGDVKVNRQAQNACRGSGGFGEWAEGVVG